MRFILVFMMPEAAKRQAIADITRWLEQGALRHYIAQPLPARRDRRRARARWRRGAIGNVVLDIAPDM